MGGWGGVCAFSRPSFIMRKKKKKPTPSHHTSQGVSVTALREVKILREMDHPHIVSLEDVVLHKRGAICLVRVWRERRGGRGGREDVYVCVCVWMGV